MLTIDANNKGLISYLRYHLLIEKENLKRLMKKNYIQNQVENLIEMSNADNRYELYDIGYCAAYDNVNQDHFPNTFKILK